MDQGWAVMGTTRSAEKAAALEAQGIQAVLFDGQQPLPDTVLDKADALLLSIPPGEGGDPVLQAHDGLTGHGFDWVGYLSTTGVYGDHGGAWVDEDTALSPSGPRGRRRMAAEAAWQAFGEQSGSPVHIFRLAGIYGPGRNPLISVRNGTARRIIKPGQVFSRIHVADIAQVVTASLLRAGPGRTYNVCDDDPAPPQDVIAHAAELLGMPVPAAIEFEQADLSPMARSFYADNKKVRNDRMKAELDIELRYPSYRDGLAALLADGLTLK